jgi:hypothetical protein
MNIAEKVIDIVKGMEGIGGIPTDEEFLNEFEFRLQALRQGQSLPIDSVIECPHENTHAGHHPDQPHYCEDCGEDL